MRRKVTLPAINTLYRVGLLILIMKTFLSSSSILPYSDVVDVMLSVAGAVVLVISILSKRWSLKLLLTYAAIVLLAAYTSYLMKSLFILLVVLVCLALRGEKTEKTIWFVFSYEVLFMVVHFVLALVMSLFGHLLYLDNGNVVRYHFGFDHPNIFSIILVNVTFMWLWLNYDNIKPKHMYSLVLIHIAFYLFTTCRTAILEVILLTFVLIIFYKNNKRTKMLTFLAQWVTPVVALFCLLAAKLYTTGSLWIRLIDNLLSSRIKLAAYAIENYGITFWGQNQTASRIVWDEYWRLNAFTFDNVYSIFFSNYGVFWLIFVVILLYKLARKGSEKTRVMIMLWAFYGMTEVHILNPFLFFPLLLVGEWLEKKS